MNADHSPRKLLTSRGFLATLAICLAAAGIFGWFALFGRDSQDSIQDAAEHQVPQSSVSSAAQAGPDASENDAPAAATGAATAETTGGTGGEPETVPATDAVPETSEASERVESVRLSESEPDSGAEEPSVSGPAPGSKDAAPVTVTAPVVPDAVETAVTVETVAKPELTVSPLSGEAIAAFSMDTLLYSETLGDWRTHDGIDIAAARGTTVLAARAGTVRSIRDDPLMGTTVVLSHSGGYESIYACLQAKPAVATGDAVTAGQILGAVGTTSPAEAAEGPHLHFAVTLDGTAIDPETFLAG